MTSKTAASVGDLATLIPSFERSMRAANKRPKTIKTYGEASRQLPDFLRKLLKACGGMEFADLL